MPPSSNPLKCVGAGWALLVMPGKYALGGKVFDPLGLGAGDPVWMREAEVKHGRIAMLAVVGYIAVDNGITFPGVAAVPSLQAHAPAVASGAMTGLLGVVVACEILHTLMILPQAKNGWESGYIPGNFGLDPFKMTSERTLESEIKNGRLAMMAISGIWTQDVLQNCGTSVGFGELCTETAKGFPYF